MEELMNILEELRPDVDFTAETALIDNGVLDSFDIISLVGTLSEAFDVEIGSANLVPANFNSAEAMYQMILKLQDEE